MVCGAPVRLYRRGMDATMVEMIFLRIFAPIPSGFCLPSVSLREYAVVHLRHNDYILAL